MGEFQRRTFHSAAIVDATAPCRARKPKSIRLLVNLHFEAQHGRPQDLKTSLKDRGKIMMNENIGISWYSVALSCAFSLAILCTFPAAAQSTATEPQVLGNAVANGPVQFDASPGLTALLNQASVNQASVAPSTRVMQAPMKPKRPQTTVFPLSQLEASAATSQPLIGPRVQASVGRSFEGVGQIGGPLDCPSVALQTVVPPDTNAAVGDTQVVQWVNTCYAVFNKSNGSLIAGPFAGTNFWKGFGGPCEANNDGDPIIQWDKANHRWLAAQNVFNGPPFFTCVAVSKTADATGGYFRYAFPQQPGFPDYPKWGLTSSVYYQTQNVFDPVSNFFLGVNVCAYQAGAMLRGSNNASQVCIFDNSNGTLFDDSMLPADDDSVQSDGSRGEVLVGAIDNFIPGGSNVYEFVFTVNFGNPAHSTLAGVDGSMPISVPAYILAFCPAGSFNTDCVPQPTHKSDLLDTLGDRLMYRLARFVDGQGVQHFLVNHSVNDTAAVAARWYEFRAPEGSTALTLFQSGQTPDDGHFRWMGSIAMDKQGDIAIGYSRSSAAAGDFPSIYFSGQQAGDARGVTEGEALIKQGGGSQLKSFDRWGDYSSMALDGADSCTFWYTNEFYPVNGSFAWDTWVASINFSDCK
jgi:hypothetical protein